MVDWNDLSSYLVSDFSAIERSPRLVEVPINFDGAPPITTYVSSAIDGNDRQWVSIDALAGPLQSFDLGSVVRAVGDIVCGLAGLALMGVAGEWRFRKWRKTRTANKRRKSLARIENINRRIKRLENDLEKEEKRLKEKIRKIAGAAG